jgi:putative ABC transport system ATP-binding protein
MLFGIDLSIDPGEIVIMTGPSGSGKTTLLTLMGALRSAQEGSLKVLGHELRNATPSSLLSVRRSIGYIFQAHNLIDSLTALENVEMSLDLLDLGSRERRARAVEAMAAVGLSDRMHHHPDQMSGGQKQRVAIARALAPKPRLILADEPTASLDKQSGREVVDLMNRLAREKGTSVLLVTHDNRILDIADRIVNLEDGRLQSFTTAVTTNAQRMLDALTRTTRHDELAERIAGLETEAFAKFLEQATGEFRQFLDVMRMASSEAFESMLEQVIEGFTLKIGRLLQADRSTLFVVDRPRGELWSKIVEMTEAIHVPLGRGIAGTVAQTGKAMNIVDAYEEPLFNRDIDDATGYRTKSILCVPMKNGAGEVFAVMQLLNKSGGVPFDAADEKRFAEFSSRLGVILETWTTMAARRP